MPAAQRSVGTEVVELQLLRAVLAGAAVIAVIGYVGAIQPKHEGGQVVPEAAEFKLTAAQARILDADDDDTTDQTPPTRTTITQ